MKKALLVGCNYPKQEHFLRGCTNDLMLWNSILKEHFGFDGAHVRTMADNACTTSRILDGLDWLVRDAQPGDVLLFQFSGHGTQMITVDYDKEIEADGMDEVIVPVDMDWRNKVVKDNDFARIFGRVPHGVHLTILLDCCHSGDSLRLFVPPEMKSPNRIRAIDMPADIAARGYGLDLTTKPLGLDRAMPRPGTLISACRSDQTASDAWIQRASRYHGAFTWHTYMVLRDHNYKIEYDDLMTKVKYRLLEEGFAQVPQLENNTTGAEFLR